MAYRAKSLVTLESKTQGQVQHIALKELKRSKVKKRLQAVIDDLTPYVAHENGLDTDAARKLVQRWVLEAAAEMIAMPIGDVIFLP